jgi:hypothetical protein
MIEAGQVYHVHVFEQVISVGLYTIHVFRFEVCNSIVNCAV